jgi:hypothetical protein
MTRSIRKLPTLLLTLLVAGGLGTRADPPAMDAGDDAPAAAAAQPAEPPQTFAPDQIDEIREKLGVEVIVEGATLSSGVSNSGTVRYLNFSQNWRSSVSLVFFPRRSNPPITDETLQAYVGKNIRVRGVLSEHNSALQIVIHTLAQIELLAPADAGAQAPSPTPAP